MDTAIFDLQSQVTFFSLCQCNRDAMNAASTHPVDMLERQEEIFIVACLKKKGLWFKAVSAWHERGSNQRALISICGAQKEGMREGISDR